MQSTELGYLNPDRSVTGVDAFGDGGVTGGEVDGEPFDTRVDLDGLIQTLEPLRDRHAVARPTPGTSPLSGRYNRTTIRNRDRIDPGGGPGSLDGDHAFSRFNPAAGVTFSPSRDAQPLRRLQRGQPRRHVDRARLRRSRTSPASCRTRWPAIRRSTRSSPGRGKPACAAQHRGVSWNAGVFRADNRDDILFVTSEQTGFGYFKNFGETRRQGLELGAQRPARTRHGRRAATPISSATFQSEETVNGESNSTNDAAEDGEPGLEGTIEIEPGDRIPLIPPHMFKAYARRARDAGAVDRRRPDRRSRARIARGNENNQHEPDGTYYLGPAHAPAYAVVNLGAQLSARQPWVQLLGAGQQSVRSPLLHGRATRTRSASPTPAPSSPGRFPPSNGEFPGAAGDVLRAGRPAAGVGRHALQVLTAANGIG